MFNVFGYSRLIFRRFKRDEEGATAIEYGLLVALIAIALMIGLGAVYDAMDGMFKNIDTAVDTSDPG